MSFLWRKQVLRTAIYWITKENLKDQRNSLSTHLSLESWCCTIVSEYSCENNKRNRVEILAPTEMTFVIVSQLEKLMMANSENKNGNERDRWSKLKIKQEAVSNFCVVLNQTIHRVSKNTSNCLWSSISFLHESWFLSHGFVNSFLSLTKSVKQYPSLSVWFRHIKDCFIIYTCRVNTTNWRRSSDAGYNV